MTINLYKGKIHNSSEEMRINIFFLDNLQLLMILAYTTNEFAFNRPATLNVKYTYSVRTKNWC